MGHGDEADARLSMSALPPADRRAAARPVRAHRIALPALMACLPGLGLGLAPTPAPAEDLPAGAALGQLSPETAAKRMQWLVDGAKPSQ